ncbi:Gag-Pro-Pol polyprotein, partial [Dictyocoela muelleri]
FTRIFLLEDIKADSIVKNFKIWLENCPRPVKAIPDLGRQYISNYFSDLLKSYDIQHIKTSPYNPTANGISERINSNIKNVLRIYKGSELSSVIQKVEINLNLTHHSILKASPVEILQGFSIFDIKNRDLSS